MRLPFRLRGPARTWALAAFAAAAVPAAAAQRASAQAKDPAAWDGVKIDYDDPSPEEKAKDDGWAYAPPIEQIFQNPAIANGLASGADAINRSVESLFDSLFYSLLDNERNWQITDTTWYATNLKRDVYSAPSGAYVVVDRVELGPRYAKELWRIHGIPITLGVDNTVEILQIYLRTDGMRLAEQEELSPLRRWVNGWFGLLGAAATLLPPSFNQNELYDPVTQLKTPLSFPNDGEDFYEMPVGSIRSYAISGGVRLAADFGGIIDGASRRLLERIGDVGLTIPYALFKRGEHRINVLRRSQHSAWVGVADLARTGHSLSPLVGQKYNVLRGALAAKVFDWNWIWGGVPIGVLPVDLNFEQAQADIFDQVYEYDMRIPEAREAYAAAVKGDFLPSRQRWLDAKERGLVSGVTFHFTRTQDRVEAGMRNGPNVAIYRKERRRDHTEAEIEITDTDGKFYVLESAHDIGDKQWDVLVGDEDQRVQHTVELRVKKVIVRDEPAAAGPDDVADRGGGDADATAETSAEAPSETPSETAEEADEPTRSRHTYVFEAEEEPYRLAVSFSIQDRYVNTVEYYRYLEELRFFSGLPLLGVPDLDLRDRQVQTDWRRRAYFADPTRRALLLHVTPTYLGRFGAQATMSFSRAQLDKIVARSEDDMWDAFARAFGKDEREWRDPLVRQSFGFQMQWWRSFFYYPARLFALRDPKVDALKEASNAIRQLIALRDLKQPVEKLDGFHQLLDTDYPRHLSRALLNLADVDQVPRRVLFSAQPKGAARHEVKTAYGKLNNQAFKEGPPFPDPGRYTRAKAKLANFYLDQPREAQDRPRVGKVQVTSKSVPASVRGLPDGSEESEAASRGGALDRDSKHVFIELAVENLLSVGPIKLYVRVEQAGRIKIGKLELAEKVIELSPVPRPSSDVKAAGFEFWLTGPLSPLSNFLFDQAVTSGDEFQVTLAVSRDGTAWSDERMLEFRFDGGRLSPVK